MVNTLSGSVSAYRKEIVKPRFIRIDEVMALFPSKYIHVGGDEASWCCFYQTERLAVIAFVAGVGNSHCHAL